MPDNKNQHFVPKFYLKNFSTNGKQIAVYHIPSQTFIPASPIKRESSAPYFYGKGDSIDNDLQILEGSTSRIISSVIKGGPLPLFQTLDRASLVKFILSLRYRTEYAKDAHNERFNHSIQSDMVRKGIIKPEAREDFKIVDTNAAQINVQNALISAAIIADLKVKLLVNRTTVPFVTSDNPCVLYNQLLENRRPDLNGTGLTSAGLQIVCPISPKHSLFFYDSLVYRVGFDYGQIVEIDSMRHVETLNLLQLVSAQNKIYLSDSNSGVWAKEFVDSGSDLRDSGRIGFQSTVAKAPDGEILHINSMPVIRTKMRLSFVATLMTAMRADFSTGIHFPRSETVMEIQRLVRQESKRLFDEAMKREAS